MRCMRVRTRSHRGIHTHAHTHTHTHTHTHMHKQHDRYLHVPVFSAERAWAYAMELKKEVRFHCSCSHNCTSELWLLLLVFESAGCAESLGVVLFKSSFLAALFLRY